jgi:predicted transcriptional regulator
VLEKNVGKKETKKEPENAQGQLLHNVDVTRKELDNSMKQIANYKKDIHKLKMKLEAALPTRIETLENELRAKDELIDELKGKVRTLEKMDKVYQTSDISKI